MSMALTERQLKKIAVGYESLSCGESAGVFEEIMGGEVSDTVLAAFLTALKMKGETVDEIVGAATAMRAKAAFINAGANMPIDTCGTGGDGADTFNISTTSAFIAAGAGVSVAKHGNRAATSKCGSADVLAALGFNLDVHPAVMEHCLQSHGIAFLFAPKMHPAMRFAASVRKALGFRTIFNLLGPLVNPAGALGQVIGVFDAAHTELLAESLKRLGSRRVFVVHGKDGLDEISVCAPTRVSELRNGSVKTYEFNPRPYLNCAPNPSELKGGTPEENAKITMDILTGKRKDSSREICVLNAAAAIVVAEKAPTIEDGVEMAHQSIDSGAALEKLRVLINFSNQR